MATSKQRKLLSQQSVSTETIMAAAHNFYLPDDCWERVIAFLNDDGEYGRYLKTLSIFSK